MTPQTVGRENCVPVSVGEVSQNHLDADYALELHLLVVCMA